MTSWISFAVCDSTRFHKFAGTSTFSPLQCSLLLSSAAFLFTSFSKTTMFIRRHTILDRAPTHQAATNVGLQSRTMPRRIKSGAQTALRRLIKTGRNVSVVTTRGKSAADWRSFQMCSVMDIWYFPSMQFLLTYYPGMLDIITLIANGSIHNAVYRLQARRDSITNKTVARCDLTQLSPRTDPKSVNLSVTTCIQNDFGTWDVLCVSQKTPIYLATRNESKVILTRWVLIAFKIIKFNFGGATLRPLWKRSLLQASYTTP